MILILVVLYEKKLANSSTLQFILESSKTINNINATLYLWDNSLVPLDKLDISLLTSEIKKFCYNHNPQNSPLSLVYNTTIDKLINDNVYKFLIILDDDSNLGNTYFSTVISTVLLNPTIELFLPIITNHSVIISPSKYYIAKGINYKKLKPGIKSSKNKMAINSGMVIAKNFFNRTNFRYDTRLDNYGTDNYFMKKYSQNNLYFYVLNYAFKHSLSFYDNRNLHNKLIIYRKVKKANLIINKDQLFENIFTHVFFFLSSLRFSIKYKDINFFK